MQQPGLLGIAFGPLIVLACLLPGMVIGFLIGGQSGLLVGVGVGLAACAVAVVAILVQKRGE